MHSLAFVALVVWGVPIASLFVAGAAAWVSPSARDFLRRNLIAE
ncbi:hypothetical protein [Sphingomonas sp. PB4P5]